MLVLKGLELTSLFRWYFRIVVFVFVLFVSVFVVIPLLLLGFFLLLRLLRLALENTEEKMMLFLKGLEITSLFASIFASPSASSLSSSPSLSSSRLTFP